MLWLAPLVFKLFFLVFYVDNHIFRGSDKEKLTIAFPIAMSVVFLSDVMRRAGTVVCNASEEMPLVPSWEGG